MTIDEAVKIAHKHLQSLDVNVGGAVSARLFDEIAWRTFASKLGRDWNSMPQTARERAVGKWHVGFRVMNDPNKTDSPETITVEVDDSTGTAILLTH